MVVAYATLNSRQGGKMFKFELGMELKERVTGFAGVVMVRTEYTTGCITYGLLSKKLKDGKVQDWAWFDESRLTPTGKNVRLEKTIGGPHMPLAPKR